MAITYPLTMPVASLRSPIAITIGGRFAVGASESPFTYKQEVIDWGGQILQASIDLPPMSRTNAEEWISFLLSLKGREGTFYCYDTANRTPRGSVSGTPAINGASETGMSIDTDGWGGGSNLKPGDWLQFGSGASATYHKNLVDVTESAGAMTLDVFPKVRTAHADSTAITYTNPVGVFRLAENVVQWTIDDAMIYGLSFNAVEAV